MRSTSLIRLGCAVLDCPDSSALARFYADLLGVGAERVIVGATDPTWCEIPVPGTAFRLAFQQVANYRAPDWPDGLPQQFHLDLDVTDLEEASRQAIALGAAAVGPVVDEPGCTFQVYLDPAGHPFLPLPGPRRVTRHVNSLEDPIR